MREFEARVCEPSQWADALALLYAHLSTVEREEHIGELIAGAERGEIRLGGLVGCWESGRIVGSILCIPSPGRSVVAWPPRYLPSTSREERAVIREHLFRGLRAYAMQQGARLAQVLLSTGDVGDASALQAEDFFLLAHLIYLRRPSNLRFVPLPRDDIEYVTYSTEYHQDFLNVLQRSYEQSFDCPQLTGARAMEDIFDSHRAQGIFDPEQWFLARQDGMWVGCLLLAGLPEYNAIEVAYIAVLPEARRTGLGHELVRKAIRVAEQTGVDILTLAVDSRNEPAMKVYESEGFTEWDRRDAYLLVLDPADGIFDRTQVK